MILRGRNLLNIRVAFLLAASAAAFAQQSNTVIDNDQVKVLKVDVQAHQKTVLHEHKVNRVMIYLQAGKQDFEYQDGKKSSLTWKANEAKWSPASGMHIAEITSANPVTIVEIELKKPGSGAKLESNPRDPTKIDRKHYKVEFENDQVRVIRVKIGPHESAPMHKHMLNRVVVYLSDQDMKVTSSDGKETHADHKAGDVAWATPGEHIEANQADRAFEVYAVEIKN